MARIIEDKLLFIHVAKTGGTYIKELLSANGIKHKETGEERIHDHISYAEIKNSFKQKPFAIIRSPHKWIVSRHSWAVLTEFNFKMKVQPTAKEHWMAKVWDDNVIKFAENIIDIMPDIPTVYFNKMTGFLENDDVQLFATENMQNCIRFIEENTNKKITDYRIMNVKKTVCKELPEEIIKEIKKKNSRTYELIELLKQ